MTAGSTYGEALGRRLYTAEQISAAIGRLAGAIAADYAGQPLLLLGVLKGALYLTVDLSRALAAVADGPSEIMVDYICVSRYGTSTESSGAPRLLLGASVPVEGQNVLLVDDIADNGLTLESLGAFIQKRRPASLRTCVLFDKPSRRRVEVPLHYAGLPLPDAFAVGYGLDYQELYRNLPYLAELNLQASFEKK
ncbi:MAG: hypoxanthine phosphoribosyltransferase [Candidatus Tumulicola sp.]